MSQQIDEQKKKREQFANQIRSAQRQKIFSENRKRLLEAKRKEDEAEIAEAEMNLLQLFDNHKSEYEMMMEWADKLEIEQRQYEQYLQKLEEESMTWQAIQRKADIEKLKQEMLQYFNENGLPL